MNENIGHIEQMRRARERPSVAFSEFTGKKKYFLTHAFCFYEGVDGKYYDERIRSINGDDVIHIKAGNKKEVLRVMKIINETKDYENVSKMFFVDRDMDFDMEEYKSEDLFVTPCYSIENLYVNEECLCKILQTEFSLNIGDQDYEKFKSLFTKYLLDFCSLIEEFNALVFLTRELNQEKKTIVRNVKTNDLVDIDINNGLTRGNKYNQIVLDIKQALEITDSEIIDAKKQLSKYGKKNDVFRGKNQLYFMTKYISLLYNDKKNLFIKDLTGVKFNPLDNVLSLYSKYANTPASLLVFLKKHVIHSNSIA